MTKSNIPKEFERCREEIEEQDRIAEELDQIKKDSPAGHKVIVQQRAEIEATAIKHIKAYEARQSKASKQRKEAKAKSTGIASKGGITAKENYDKKLLGRFYIEAIKEVNRLIDAGEVRRWHHTKNKSDTVNRVCDKLLRTDEFKTLADDPKVKIDYEVVKRKTKKPKK